MKDSDPDKWMTVDFAIAYEPYAYICRENDSDFRDFVNNTILWSIKTGKFYELYEKWMGPKGLVPIKMSQAYKDYLQMIVYPSMTAGGWPSSLILIQRSRSISGSIFFYDASGGSLAHGFILQF